MTDQFRQQAWAYGRTLRNRLVGRYREEYGIDVPPAPALIIDELLTDFMDVALHFDPLDLRIFAQTEWRDGRPLVTVNSLTMQMPGVKDVAGVQNVAKFHEMVHVDRDLAVLQPGPQIALPESGPSPKQIVCYRELDTMQVRSYLAEDDYLREVWAEESGRAAAVSYSALYRSEAFHTFLNLPWQGDKRTSSLRWRLLNWAAEDIGVNRSALVKQLELEGQIKVQQLADSNMVYPQHRLLSLMGEE